MAGYQGWFRVEGDGTSSKRYSYGNEERSGIDMWPDVSEYEKTYETPFKLANGKKSRFFSSHDKSTVDLHFKWMKDYNVDGAFMQRFFGTRPRASFAKRNRFRINCLNENSSKAQVGPSGTLCPRMYAYCYRVYTK